MDRRHVAALAAAASGGAAIALSFLRFPLWPAGWVAFVPIVAAAATAGSVAAALRIGLAAGLVTNVPAFYWLVGTINGFGGFPLWLSLIFYLALSAYSALQFVLFTVAVRRSGFGPLALSPALAWVTLEFFYPNLFPWRLANSQLLVTPLLQVGEWTGPFGLSLVMVWMAGAVARALVDGVRAARNAIVASAAAVAGIALFGILRLPAVEAAVAAAPIARVGIVQGNLTLEEKNDVRFFESNLSAYRDLSQEIAPRADVIIWPETVIGEPLPRSLETLSQRAVSILGLEGPLLTGALTYAGSAERPLFYNSVVLFDGGGRLLGLSDKQILMPFGEYMPFGSVFPWLKDLSPMTGDFQAGTEVRPLDVPGVGRFAPLNCYEDLKAPIARRAVHEGGAEVLFAVANDAWFGDTEAPYQHEALALWRAVENRRFLIRVTNTGVTDVIDPAGRIVLQMPVFRPASAVAEVRRLDLETFYSRFGDVFAWLVSLGAGAALLRRRS